MTKDEVAWADYAYRSGVALCGVQPRLAEDVERLPEVPPKPEVKATETLKTT